MALQYDLLCIAEMMHDPLATFLYRNDSRTVTVQQIQWYK